MQQAISTGNIQVNHGVHLSRHSIAIVVKRFFVWCDTQETDRFKWLAMAFVAGIGTILPLTLFAIVFFGNNNFNLWVVACAVNVPILIVSLAVQPMKLTLPAIFFAWLVDAIMVTYCIGSFLAG